MRRSNKIKSMKGIDRLSDFPDEILLHILSFLDTPSSVRSSLLSRRWRSLWKYVPVLTFSRDLFRTQLDFELHVIRILSLRSDCDVRKITIESDVLVIEVNLFDRMMKYAARHRLQHLNLRRSLVHGIVLKAITAVFGCYQSLKVLELNETYLDPTFFGSLSRLQQLVTLNLRLCRFDRFGGSFAKLENLTLIDCTPINNVLKLYATQLLTLNIRWMRFDSIEIVAPKLRYLCWHHYGMIPDVSMTSKLPSLHRADVSLYCDGDEFVKLERYASLFHVLYNVQSLHFYSKTWKMLIQTCESAKHQSCPFKRMKSLTLTCSKGSCEVPDEVIRYFFDKEEVRQVEEISVGVRHRKNWKICLRSSESRLLEGFILSPVYISTSIHASDCGSSF